MDTERYFIVCAKVYFLKLKVKETIFIDKLKNGELLYNSFLKLNENITFFGKNISPVFNKKKETLFVV